MKKRGKKPSQKQDRALAAAMNMPSGHKRTGMTKEMESEMLSMLAGKYDTERRAAKRRKKKR